MCAERQKIVVDTSAIINGEVTRLIQSGELSNVIIIIPVAALDELQAQASKGRTEGMMGLSEIKKIRELGIEKGVELQFVGERPSLEDIKLAKGGRIDAIIRDVAKKEGATLYTSDYVQFLVAEAEGVPARFLMPEEKVKKIGFESFFTDDTMSVHLKVGVPPLAKKGRPGSIRLVKLREDPLTVDEIQGVISDVMWAVRHANEGSLEIVRNNAIVAQIGQYRVAITKPPFSDDHEVTIVRPIVKLRLEDYHLSEKLMNRLSTKAEGLLIAGPPGSGKSTFASSLAEFYSGLGKIVKTFESPRDLQVSHEITQYGPLEGDFEKTAEILLLVRPDYTIFDEMRRPKDFQIYADMRLAGVGMVGVIHASDPIDAIQRFLGKTELGMLPHIVDTVIFIKDGMVQSVYELRLAVRVPTGMKDEDLSRPIVEVVNFLNDELVYEIYKYGEETVVVPIVSDELSNEVVDEIKNKILRAISRITKDPLIEVVAKDKVIVKVSKEDIPRILGKKGQTIRSLEKKLNVSILVEPKVPTLGKEIKFNIYESGNSIEINVDEKLQGEHINIYLNDRFLFSAIVGKLGKIRINKNSDIGRRLMKHLMAGESIKIYTDKQIEK
ncbi:MAG: PINc/VapC family ATPase [Nitrososphaerota archaeon]